MSAELEEARALGELVEAGLAAEAHDRLRGVGRRGAGAARLDGMGRGSRAGAARQGRRLHQHRRQRPRVPERRRLARARSACQRGRARRRGSGDEGSCLEAHAGAGDCRPAPGPRAEARSRADLRIGALGSGSDYSPFLQHAGIPSLNLSFGGLDRADGIYHSIYDDYYHFTKFLDTDFAYGRALAQTVGTAVIRLADADVLPFQFTHLADTVQTYVRRAAGAAQRAAGRGARAQPPDRGRCLRVRSPIRVAAVRRRRSKTMPPALNFAPLENAASGADACSRSLSQGVRGCAGEADAGGDARVNARLIQSERQLTDAAGLPRRPWYRHLLYAPGFYTGYAVKTMPGVREAIEQKHYAEAEAEIVRVARALEREKALVDGAAADLEKASVRPVLLDGPNLLLRLLCGLRRRSSSGSGRCCSA